MVQRLKLTAYLESRRSRIRRTLRYSAFKETNVQMFLPRSYVNIQFVRSLRGQKVAWSASDRQASGQYHLIHLTILKRFSWPSLVYICAQWWPKTPFSHSTYHSDDISRPQNDITLKGHKIYNHIECLNV